MKNQQIQHNLLWWLGAFVFALAGCRSVDTREIDHPRPAFGVAVEDVRFFSAALQRQMIYRVYLPAQLDPARRLPVVYLLHGGNGSFRDWSNNSDVAQYAAIDKAGGMILVMPEGAFSYWMNAELKPEEKYQDYLTHDLISDVESRFPAAQGRENRAIVGISMGGFAAVKLALTSPELFGFAGALSPSIDILHRRFSPKRIGEWWRIRTIFGPQGSSSRQLRDPFALVRSSSPAVAPYLYITAGEQEPLLEPNRRFTALLKQHHFAYEFHTKPGGHDWGEWDSQIPGCFESLFLHLKTNH